MDCSVVPSDTWKETILTQYSASTRILGIIETFNQAVSLDEFTDKFIDEVRDVTTAGTFGLDIWGKIVGVSRYVIAPVEDEVFGFVEGDNNPPSEGYPTPFNDAPFKGRYPSTRNLRLEDNAYRTLLMCKAFTNISIATIPEINRFLTMLFKERGRVFCVNQRNMQITFVAEFPLEQYEANILRDYNVSPVPSGVKLNIIAMDNPVFGFTDEYHPFNDGTFYRNYLKDYNED